MSSLSQIINTQIVPLSQDVFWAEFPGIKSMQPRPVLVLAPPFSPGSAEEEQLNGILRAGCKLTEQHYNLVHIEPSAAAPWHQLRDTLQPKVILLFGVSPEQLGIRALFKLNDINQFDRLYWIPAVSLSHLQQDKTQKGLLWNNALKPFFETKVRGDVLA